MFKCCLETLLTHFMPRNLLEKTNMFNKLTIGLAISSVIVGTSAYAATDIQANPKSSAYLQDSRGTITRSGTDLCWRSGFWTPADAVPGCDGELLPPIAKPTAPAVVATPAAPATVPPAPMAQKRCDFTVTLANDQAFAFNKAVLSSAAKKRIDSEVISKLDSCSKVDIVIITGHTDRLGTQQYNQKLSDKRAAVVAAYLKAKGVSAPIDTLGVGQTQPVKSCNAKLSRKKLIECLAPNRRVVIEARGIAK
jgi:OOP family OmpA-OmpF porin